MQTCEEKGGRFWEQPRGPKNTKICKNLKLRKKSGKILKGPGGFKTTRNLTGLDVQEKRGQISKGLKLSEISQATIYEQKDFNGV